MYSYQPTIKERFLQYFLRRKSAEGFRKAPIFRSTRVMYYSAQSVWHIYRHIYLTNHQKNHQTSPLTPLDTSTPSLTPLDPSTSPLTSLDPFAHLYCLTNQRTYQMLPLAPWDPLRGLRYPIWFNSMFEFCQKMIHSIFDSILLDPRFNSKYYSLQK